MMTETQFRIHPKLRNSLAQVLSQEAVIEALAIIQDKAKPRSSPEPRPNAHLDTLVAHDYHFKRGIQCALDTLGRLVKEPDIKEEQETDEGEFTYSLPQEIRDALNKKRND